MFFRKTVEGIVANVSHSIEQLKTVSAQSRDDARSLRIESARLDREALRATAEADRAERIAINLGQLIK